MKNRIRKFALFAAAALVLGTLFQWILEWTVFSNASSQAAMSFAQTSRPVIEVFGEVRNIKVVRLTDYGNATEHRRERKYVLSVAGSLANGTVVVVDIAPNAGHSYAIGDIDAYRKSE